MKEQVFFRAFDNVVEKSDDNKSDVISIKFVISTPKRDRANDTIAIDGWDTKSFDRNPVVLWAHDKSLPPIAKASGTLVKGKKLVSVAEFTPADYAHPLGEGFGHTVGRMYRDGFLNTVSVGFRAVAWDERPDGVDFRKQELLEYSGVPIPMNPDALAVARAAGIDTKPLYRWCEMAMDQRSISLPPSTVSDELLISTYRSLKREHAPSLVQRIFKHEAKPKKTKREKEMDELREAIKALTETLRSQEQEDRDDELVSLIKELTCNVKALSDEVKELREKQAEPEPQAVEQDDDLEFDAKSLSVLIAEQVKSALDAKIKALG